MLCCLVVSVAAQESKPVAHNEQFEANKFRTRDIIDVESMVWGTDASDFIANSKCPHRIYQQWATEVEASVYSTPIIVDVASDGVKDVVVPTFIKHIEVLDGPHGHRAAGFPFTFPNSAFYASPMVYDINFDGAPDIGVTTFNGEIIWLTENGMPIFGKSMKIPHLKVKKFWYHGLKPDPQDMAHTGHTQFEIERMEGEDKDPLRAQRGYFDPTYERPTDSMGGGMHVAEELDAYGLATQLIANADLNMDRLLTSDEFVAHARVDDPAMSPEEASELFASIDEDKDGQLDLSEVIKHMDDLDQNDSENVFNLADSDGDSVLSMDEFMAHARMAHAGKSDYDLDQFFNDADENRDGLVDLDEAKRHWNRFDVHFGKGSKGEVQQSKAERVKEKGISREEVKQRASEQLKQQMMREGGQSAEAPAPFNPPPNPPPPPKQEQAQQKKEKKPPPAPPPPPPAAVAAPPAAPAEEEAKEGGEKGGTGLEGVLGKMGLGDVYPGLQALGVSELSDLQFVGDEDLKALALPGVKANKLKSLIKQNTPRDKRPKRRLMGGAALDDVQLDQAADESGDVAGDDMPLGDVEGDDGKLLDSDDDAMPEAPRDGEELIDGEPNNNPDPDLGGWDSMDDYGYYEDDYHYGYGYHGGYKMPSDDEVASKIVKEKYEAKVKSWEDQPLSAPGDSQWSTLKGYFAPQLDEQEKDDKSHFKAHVLGHDEVFTRLMSVDRHVLLEALRRNASKPFPGDRPKEDGHVFIDAHCLSTPIIADLDADGRDEIIVAVSYYFDKDQYSDPSAFEDLDVDVKLNKYVAGGIVAMDVQTGAVKFQVHLDLTTDETVYRAYLYSSPTVADLDADGKLEVIIGTSLGFIYVLDHTGQVRPNFPITMAEIQGQIGVADVNNDGQLELIATDNRFNVAAFSSKGKELWEKRISGYSAQGPTLGDINNDGIVDVVVATTNGHLWALNGKTGEVLKNFPVKAGGSIMAPPLILKFPSGIGKSIVVPAHDGYLYIVDGVSGCAHKMDIGENSYSMVLVDDLNGNGKLDLLVSTMNGNVMSFGTDIPYEPLKTWTSREQGNNNVELRDGRQGIFVLDRYRHHHDNSGATMMVGFEIVDTRPIKGFGGRGGSYQVRFSAGGSVTLFQKTYTEPGQYLEEVPCPAKRQYSTIFVEMKNELGQHFEDQVAMSFNMHFYRALKWVLITPFLAMSGVLFFVKDMQHVLPL